MQVLKRNESLVVLFVCNIIIGKEHGPLVSTESIGDVMRLEEVVQFPFVIKVYERLRDES